ncbi:hypothetical protein P154DRAFT_345336 [Amniculicola lignicola CBS 123094]|uniref:Uncharacterized protein n=1 Tax=Amniculicola lignicola CBS 123094 TaxID=1392246 RepID=A0A6A5W0V6_9PLEO|nr:hypothetical protein P154DRAFT_345336 [Amniculicola lignicola CBS 123094]
MSKKTQLCGMKSVIFSIHSMYACKNRNLSSLSSTRCAFPNGCGTNIEGTRSESPHLLLLPQTVSSAKGTRSCSREMPEHTAFVSHGCIISTIQNIRVEVQRSPRGRRAGGSTNHRWLVTGVE